MVRGVAVADSSPMATQSIPSVFLVDDSEPVRERLKELLELRAEVRIVGEADTAALAVTKIRAAQPDFVVLDYQLGDGTGLDVLREVREDAPRSCFIVLTNHVSADLRESFVNAGAHCLLDKSHEFGRLAKLIAELHTASR
jgi:DNA-binding NarL/FixJ family response regulator